jgi:DNA-directed RNA polymerase subunit beta'
MSNLTNEQINYSDAVSEVTEHDQVIRLSEDDVSKYVKSFFYKNSPDKIKISIASPNKIRERSCGEVLKADTINYRTLKPERDGLFCSKIFGPIKNYECLCGKYRGLKYEGVVCEKCGTEITTARVRRERMGHVNLSYPVLHPWFWRAMQSKIATLLNIPNKLIEPIVYFELYVVTDPGLTDLNVGDVLEEEAVQEALDKYGSDAFKYNFGSEAILELIKKINMPDLYEKLTAELKTTNSRSKRASNLKRATLLKSLINSGNNPEWMVLNVLPVLPPDLRPLVLLDGGRFASSDLNDLYRRVINRNNRLKQIIELGAPSPVVVNEKRMLQEAVEALLDNKKIKVTNLSGSRPLKSLADMLKGKQGRFRQNLLGKRVDYSARSVIVVGPNLELHQCGLPKAIAIELFRPFIIAKMELYGDSTRFRSSREALDLKDPMIWEILDEVVKGHPILLNRAPTLHRLGIQAFEPKLLDTKAIQLHPLTCKAFNADFDGDQMAVHLPISLEAQTEARVLIMSTSNTISPSSGLPIITPDKDVVLGIYYITLMIDYGSESIRETRKIKSTNIGLQKIYYSVKETEVAVILGHVKANQKIHFINSDCEDPTCYETTPGRVMLYSCLPLGQNKISFSAFNKLFKKKDLETIFSDIYQHFPQSVLVSFADKVLQLGFKYSTIAAISFGKDDIVVPEEKKEFVEQSYKKISDYELNYSEGYITQGEKYNKVTDEWQFCINKVTDAMMEKFSKTANSVAINSIFMMADSGARGSVAQIKQLAGMRGLMTKPNGDIIETPIISNFKEGLTVLEYFISAHGARKGMADTALKTADAGYLTRRLVDVSHKCIVTSNDCGTMDGVEVYTELDGSRVIKSLGEVCYSRVFAEDLKDKKGNLILPRNTLITKSMIPIVDSSNVSSIKVRSVITCASEYGICAKCYGRNLTSEETITVGDPVGIIAAQSIGEPGTQLTMRTFHVGGVAFKHMDKPFIQSTIDGIISFIDARFVTNKKGDVYVVSNTATLAVENDNKDVFKHILPYGSKVLVADGQKVKQGQVIYEADVYNTLIISEYNGTAEFADFIKDISYREDNADTGVATKVIIKSNLHPRIMLKDGNDGYVKTLNNNAVRYFFPISSVINIEDGENISIGDIIAKVPKAEQKSKDITGGLPRVVDLFEARRPAKSAILSEADGVVIEVKHYRSKKKILVRPQDGTEDIEYMVAKDSHILVHDGSVIKKGEMIADGDSNPHDILRIRGVKSLISYMIEEIQSVYKLQGVKIDNRHIEVIIKYMLQKVAIDDVGDSDFSVGQKIGYREAVAKGRELEALGLKAPTFTRILQGITDSSLQNESFISSASFQETARVLTEAAIAGESDELLGIKENVIIGKLIPVGTGFKGSKLAKLAKYGDGTNGQIN